MAGALISNQTAGKGLIATLTGSLGLYLTAAMWVEFNDALGTLFGPSIGVIIGTLFSIYIEYIRNFVSDIFNITLFPEEIYFLSKMPSEIDPQSIILISFCSIISTVIVSIFPATQAAKLDAVKTLKYE